MTCTSTRNSYTDGKPKGPVCDDTKSVEVAAPTFKRGFVMPKFWSMHWFVHRLMVTGEMGLPARMAARLQTCHQHLVHLLRVMTQMVVSLNPVGTKTMSASHRAHTAAPTPATGTSDPIQAFADAHNALSMAVFYLRQPKANVPGARRKAVQALAALRGLDLSLEG